MTSLRAQGSLLWGELLFDASSCREDETEADPGIGNEASFA